MERLFYTEDDFEIGYSSSMPSGLRWIAKREEGRWMIVFQEQGHQPFEIRWAKERIHQEPNQLVLTGSTEELAKMVTYASQLAEHENMLKGLQSGDYCLSGRPQGIFENLPLRIPAPDIYATWDDSSELTDMPGCYAWFNALTSEIYYVGKAVKLRQRILWHTKTIDKMLFGDVEFLNYYFSLVSSPPQPWHELISEDDLEWIGVALWFTPKYEREYLEARLVRVLQPTGNIQRNL